MENLKTLKVGMVAPDFSLKDTSGVKHSLQDYLGKKNVVVAFCPTDFLIGSTVVIRSLRDAVYKVEDTDSVILGIYADTTATHKTSELGGKYNFSLLTDTDYAVSKLYDTNMDRFNASSVVTFLIDKAGYIRAIHRDVDLGNYAADIVKQIQENIPQKVKAGKLAPDFVASDQNGEIYQLGQFKGEKNVVLAFYPKDFTSG